MIATLPISTQTIISTIAKTRSEKKLMGLYNRPVADMPAEDEAYDYSHFDYLNDKFDLIDARLDVKVSSEEVDE